MTSNTEPLSPEKQRENEEKARLAIPTLLGSVAADRIALGATVFLTGLALGSGIAMTAGGIIVILGIALAIIDYYVAKETYNQANPPKP